MSFCDVKDLQIGNLYKLAEIVENKEVSSGDYFLVLINKSREERFPILGFSKAKKNKNGTVDVFLKEDIHSLVVPHGGMFLGRIIAGKFIHPWGLPLGIIPV